MLSHVRRLFFFGALASVISLPAVLPGGAAAAERPNILFIFADDHAYNAVGCMGNDEVRTPHLDRLAESGTVFTHAYNQGAWHGAVCVASRGMLNSGRHIWHTKAADFGNEMNRADRVTLWSEYMKQAGYETYFAGKWHTMGRPEKLFDHAGTERPGMPNDVPDGYDRPREGQPDKWSPSDPRFEGYWKGGKHWSEVLADEGVRFIEQAATREKPFFMYLAFNAPHDPRQSPQRYVDMYPQASLSMPASFVPMNPDSVPMGCGPTLRDERLAPFPRTEYAVRVQRGEYFALITHMDDQIGRMLKALEESGQADNTHVIYSADHGLAMGAHGLMGKQSMYEHSMRAPLIFSGPGIKKNRRIKTPVYIQDLMPSSLALAGAAVPDEVEFKSLLPLMKDPAAPHYAAIYGAYQPKSQRMVVKDGMKLILYPRIKRVLLFNLNDDPRELRDLADDPGRQATIKALYGELKKQQQVVGDELDLDAYYAF